MAQQGETDDQHASAAGSTAARTFEPIYAIFQGGGAKGITHVGALKAIEEEGLVPVGLAGTSAGAIVAALVAVGYRADELLDPVAKTTILAGKSPVYWLGRLRWIRFRLIRLIGWPLAILNVSALLALVGMILANLLWPLPQLCIVIPLLVLGASALILAILLIPPLIARGLFPSTRLRDLINERLRTKLAEHYKTLGIDREPPRCVTFADIDPVAVPLCRALKIVTSDVRGRQLVLFDAATPCASVADAVTASAAIPFAFAPPSVSGWVKGDAQVFADGGLVSNLPSWVFTVEKRALERQQQGPPIPIVAFTLVPPKKESMAISKRLSLKTYITDVLETGIFGGQTVVEQFIADLDLVELPTPLSTFGFDCGWEAAVRAYQSGRTEARRSLGLRRREAQLTSRLLQLVLTNVQKLVVAARTQAGEPMPVLRLSIVDPAGPRDREASEFRVSASANMEGDADDRLPLDPRNSAAPQAFRDRQAVFATVAAASARDLWMTKYEHALVKPGLCSIIAVPVFGRGPRAGMAPPPVQRVLCLDSSDSLRREFDDPNFMATLTRLSVAASQTLLREQLIEEQRDGGTSNL